MIPDLLNDGVVCEWDPVAVHLAVAAFVDELTHSLQVGVTPGNVGLNTLQQTKSGLGDLEQGNERIDQSGSIHSLGKSDKTRESINILID